MCARPKANNLRMRLKKLGLSARAIEAAWPSWWSDEADTSESARVELGFSVARKLGIDPRSLLDDEQPRFVWRDEARFKHLSGEGVVELAAITSFGRALGSLLIAGSPPEMSTVGFSATELRQTFLKTRRWIELSDLLALCWAIGIPVVHIRIFPWPQKRMAAMTVRVGHRSAILLGKDSSYPPHIAFYLAHEIGHLLLSHLSDDRVIVDLDTANPKLDDEDFEEESADRFALELLTGSAKPVVLPLHGPSTAAELAQVTLESGAELRIEPGMLALCFAYSTNRWATANASLRKIYDSPRPVWREVNKVARQELDFDRIPEDAVEYLEAVLGSVR